MKMGEQVNSVSQERNIKGTGANEAWPESRVVMKVGDDVSDSTSIGSSVSSMNSAASSCSSELIEDATSSVSCSSSSSSSPNGPLYELSGLLVHLPIKRGLSKYYEGKSQSFISLASVKSLEDLLKKTPHRKNLKPCKSYAGGLDGHKSSTLPKATISKKAPRGSFLSSVSKRVSSLAGSRPPFRIQMN